MISKRSCRAQAHPGVLTWPHRVSMARAVPRGPGNSLAALGLAPARSQFGYCGALGEEWCLWIAVRKGKRWGPRLFLPSLFAFPHLSVCLEGNASLLQS